MRKLTQREMWLSEGKPFETLEKGEVGLSDFNVVKGLGQGAYGKVVCIQSKRSKKKYALKVIAKNLIEKLRMVDQLKNEVTIMNKLQHPNIVKLITHFEDSKNIYCVLELALEGHLYSRVRKVGKYDEQKAASILYDIFKAVNYMHEQDPPIIHRDIKPENILFFSTGVKLADFGWSNIHDKVRNTFCGTPDYLAPEMILERGHDHKLDVWTLGILMYELIVGRAPFSVPKGIKNPQMKNRILERNIMTAKVKFPPFVSKHAKDLIGACLNKRPDYRPSCREALCFPWFKQFGFLYDPPDGFEIIETENGPKKIPVQSKASDILGLSQFSGITTVEIDIGGAQGSPESHEKTLGSSEANNIDTPQSVRINRVKGKGMTTSEFNKSPFSFNSEKFKDNSHKKTKSRDREDKKSRHIATKKKFKHLKSQSQSMDFSHMTIKELAKIDPLRALGELTAKYSSKKLEAKQLSSVLSIKTKTIQELEQQIKDTEDKILKKGDGSYYTKKDIENFEEIKRIKISKEMEVESLKLYQIRVEELESDISLITDRFNSSKKKCRKLEFECTSYLDEINKLRKERIEAELQFEELIEQKEAEVDSLKTINKKLQSAIEKTKSGKEVLMSSSVLNMTNKLNSLAIYFKKMIEEKNSNNQALDSDEAELISSLTSEVRSLKLESQIQKVKFKSDLEDLKTEIQQAADLQVVEATLEVKKEMLKATEKLRKEIDELTQRNHVLKEKMLKGVHAKESLIHLQKLLLEKNDVIMTKDQTVDNLQSQVRLKEMEIDRLNRTILNFRKAMEMKRSGEKRTKKKNSPSKASRLN